MLRCVGLMHITDRKAVGVLRGDMVAADVAGSECVDSSAEKVFDSVLLPVEVNDLSGFRLAALSIKISGNLIRATYMPGDVEHPADHEFQFRLAEITNTINQHWQKKNVRKIRQPLDGAFNSRSAVVGSIALLGF